MPEHSPGRLVARLHEDPVWVLTRGGDPLDVLFVRSQSNDEANAKHLEACWNACAGIKPEAVPEMVGALEMFVRSLPDAVKWEVGGHTTFVKVSYEIQIALCAAYAKAKPVERKVKDEK